MSRKAELTPLLWMAGVACLIIGLLTALVAVFSYKPKVFKQSASASMASAPKTQSPVAGNSPGASAPAEASPTPPAQVTPAASEKGTGYLLISLKASAQAIRNGYGKADTFMSVDGFSPTCSGKIVALSAHGYRVGQTQFADEPLTLKLDEVLCIPAQAALALQELSGSDSLTIEGLSGSTKTRSSGLSVNIPTGTGYAQVSLWALSADFCDAEVSCEDVGNANAWVAYSIMSTRQALPDDNRIVLLRDAYEASRQIHAQQATRGLD